MIKSAFLFDLDGTLIDTSGIDVDRQLRAWKVCVQRAKDTLIYPGVADALANIKTAGGRIAIVTTSVSYYAENMLRFHRLPYDGLVHYHSVKNTKPAPDGYLLALKLLNATAGESIGIGDDIKDAMSLKTAGITSVGAAWNPRYHAQAAWDTIAATPADLLKI